METRKLFQNNDFDKAISIIEEKEIKWKMEKSNTTNKEYFLFDYGIDASKTDIITKECRGLVLQKGNCNIVRYGFYRFMNYNETGCDVSLSDDIDFEFEEKSDGSLIFLSYFEDEKQWVAGSRGAVFPSAIMSNGMNLQQIFWKILKVPQNSKDLDFILDKNICYLFELCSLLNRVVIPYSSPNLVLLGGRRKDKNWEELKTEELDSICSFLQEKVGNHIRRPKIFSFSSISDCLKRAEGMSSFEEGFVIKKWNKKNNRYDRAKVKSPAYIDLHQIVTVKMGSLSGMTRMVLFDQKECIKDFPEYLEIYQAIKEKIENFCKTIEKIVKEIKEFVHDIEDTRERKKRFALKLKERDDFNRISLYCFALYKDDIELFEFLKEN
jgi:hypothetical protein